MDDKFDRRTHRFPESRYFEDLAVGERFYIPSRTVTEANFAAFQTVSADNHPIHYDIEYCRERDVAKLLFNGTGLRGIPVPSLVDRFLMVEEWATAAQSMVTVSLVINAEYIHPEKFGVVLARSLGLTCDVHTSEDDALRWLGSAHSPDPLV